MVDGEVDLPDGALARFATARRAHSEWPARLPEATAEILEGVEGLSLRRALPIHDEVIEATDVT